MREFFRNILKDKSGTFSLRETVVAIFVVVTLIAWMAEQFFFLSCPEFMFYGFVSLIAAGCFGYSLERKPIFNNPFKQRSNNDKQQE
jgi:hypothetical protein